MNIDDRERAEDPAPYLQGNALERAHDVNCQFFPGEEMLFFPREKCIRELFVLSGKIFEDLG